MMWVFNDGGRSQAKGFGGTGDGDDCVVRAISIATEQPYAEVYAAVTETQRQWCHTSRARHAKVMRERGKWHARHGVHKEVIRLYMESIGWTWVPTMQIGSGTTVHLDADELPPGRLVVNVSKHSCAVVDGVVHDTHDPTRDGTRAVYGYYHRSAT
jgi:hypothetical protein